VYRTVLRITKNQATQSPWISWIIFNDLATGDSRFQIRDGNVFGVSFLLGMKTDFILATLNFDLLISSISIRFF
jgi:hypothetical protein